MQSFLTALIECSVAMSVLTLLFIAITPSLSKRYSAKWRYYAWLVIVIGLIIPFRFHLETALIRVDAPASLQAATQAFPMNGGNVVAAKVSTTIPWYLLAGCLWLAGVFTTIAFYGLKHRRFIRMVKRWGDEVVDQKLLAVLHSLQDDMGISKQVKMIVCSCITSPMMIGFSNPVILLPHMDFSESELSLVLMHELVHFKRRDLWYKSLVLLATSIHWFNPVVYLMARAVAQQCEISCDEEVVKGGDADRRQQYSETIIGVIENSSKMQTAFSTNLYGGKKDMKNRISSIMDTSKKKAGAVVLCLALIGTMCTGVAFAADSNTGDANKCTSFSSNSGDVQKSTYSGKMGTPAYSCQIGDKEIHADTQEKLLAAVKTYLDDQVSSGKLTQTLADQIYNAAAGKSAAGTGVAINTVTDNSKAKIERYDGDLPTSVPYSFSIGGRSIHTYDKAEYLSALKAALDDQVSSGKMTQADADQVYSTSVGK